MVHVPDDVFDALLERAIADLPAPFAELLERVPVIVDPIPSPALFAVVEDAEELLGLFVGPTLEDWDATDAAPETAVIYLFQRHLEEACATRAELEHQIRITLFHELGHALGFDEEGLTRLGLE